MTRRMSPKSRPQRPTSLELLDRWLSVSRAPGGASLLVFPQKRSKLRKAKTRPQALEFIMQGDPKVIEYLNTGLRHELTAINQYWLHYRLLDNWGLSDMAKVWRKESIEEMQHADRITDRVIFLEGFPNMQVLDPLRIGQNVKEIIDCDLAAEISARTLYEGAATHCHSVKDYVTRDLFENLMMDEEHHIDFLETQLDLINRIGLELYTQKHVGGLESKEH
jgi:bacterioferritin